MLQGLRQRRWWTFTAFILAMLVLCVVLSRWQWHRYQLRLAQNDRLDAATTGPAVPVADLLDAQPAGAGAQPLSPELEWRSVTATGTFDATAETAVRRRPLDGTNGFWIVTPLVTDAGVLLVNRGWAPAGRDAVAAPEAPGPPAGQVTVTGRLRSAEVTEQAEAPPPGQSWAADPQVLIRPTSTQRFNAYLELRTSEPASDAGLRALSDPGHRGLNNLVYSIQWLLFGLVALIGWWRLIRDDGRQAVPEAELDAAQR